MHRGWEGFALLAALLLVVPTTAAAADDVHGLLATQGTVVLAGPANATLSNVSGILVPNLSAGLTLNLRAPHGRACLDSKQFARTASVPVVGGMRNEIPNPSEAPDCHAGSTFVLSTTGAAGGVQYVGLDASSLRVNISTQHLSVLPSQQAALLSRDFTNTTDSGDTRNRTFFEKSVDSPNLLIMTAGHVEGTFTGILKIRGLALDFSSSEGAHHYATGDREPNGPVGTETVTWSYVEVEGATFTLDSKAPVELIADAASTHFTGTLSFTNAPNAKEQLLGSQAAYTATSSEETITGTLDTSLTPTSSADVAQLDVAGSIISTSFQRVVPTPASPASPLLALALGAAVVGATGGGYVVYRSFGRRLRACLSESIDEDVQTALTRGEAHRALRLARWARRIGLGNPSLLLAEAEALGNLGRVAKALRVYDRALVGSIDGTPALQAALLLEQTNASPQDVEAWALRALELTPSLAFDIDQTTFPRLADEPSWIAALAKARSRAQGRGPKQP
ncbi:MAG: hypothetical protein QOE90_1496 [Thermoplasmata archaeon]|jgi:hypothetical protein|nr:hypothetical protein [Thermoplasmata archaeon]